MLLPMWNINSLRKRLDRLVLWPQATGVDVVCLLSSRLELGATEI